MYSWQLSTRKMTWSCLGFPSTDHSLRGVSCLALTRLFSYFSPSCLLATSRLSVQSSRGWEQMSHLHTERFVFWKCGRRGTETTEERGLWWLFAGLKAFFKHYSTDYCTVAFTGFRDDQKKYTWTHTLQTFYRLFRVCSLVSQSLFTLYLHCFLSDFTQSWCLSLDVLYKFIFMSVTALTSHGAHEHIAAVWSVLQYLSIWLFCSNLGKMF